MSSNVPRAPASLQHLAPAYQHHFHHYTLLLRYKSWQPHTETPHKGSRGTCNASDAFPSSNAPYTQNHRASWRAGDAPGGPPALPNPGHTGGWKGVRREEEKEGGQSTASPHRNTRPAVRRSLGPPRHEAAPVLPPSCLRRRASRRPGKLEYAAMIEWEQ